MSISRLTTVAKERGSITFTVSWSDDVGAVTPTSLSWSWTDTEGNAVNSRSGVDVDAGDLSEEMTFKLTGADLSVDSEQEIRVFSLWGTYLDRDGTTLNMSDAVEVAVDRIIGYTA